MAPPVLRSGAVPEALPIHLVPKSKCVKKGSRKYYSREVHKLMIKKRHLWKKCKLNPQMRWQYRDCVDELRSKCCDVVKEGEEHIIRSNNLGLFYRHINSRIQYRAPISALTGSTGIVVTSDRTKANTFNNYFASVGVKDDGKIPFCSFITVTDLLETVSFTESSIIFAINKLKPNLSSGPDNLPPFLFKQLKHCLAGPLSLLFTQLLSVGAVPEDWTKAIITPVFKKGTAGDVCNYRPISLTCVACKLMERIIARHIYNHLVSCNLLTAAQHGFVRSRSTCTNLLESVNDWTLVIQNRRAVTIAYIDFTRAFDSVSHEKLFARLYMYGIRGNVLQWLQNFFKDRTHQTRVGECLSDVCNLLSGVVQGSGIGPIMFIVYINELAQLLECYGIIVKLFADDVKVYLEVVNVDDANKLQKALDLIVEWANEWQLQLSVNKCNILNVGYAPFMTDYYVYGSVLSKNSSCRDLGVTITHDLSPSLHIGEITAKAHLRANCILRCFLSGDVNLLVRAFIVYVRPIVEYCSVVWSPSLKHDIDLIEKVQRRFTKRLRGLQTYSYSERLQYLGLPSLELRRLHLDLIFCYKIVFGIVNVSFSSFFKFSSVTNTRGHLYKLTRVGPGVVVE